MPIQRITTLLKGNILNLIKKAENSSLELLLQNLQEKFRSEESTINQSIASLQGQIEILKAQKKQLAHTCAQITQEIHSLLKTGEKEQASKRALNLQELKEEALTLDKRTKDAQQKLETAQAQQSQAIKLAKEKLQKIEQSLQKSKARHNLQSQTETFKKSLETQSNSLQRLEELIQNETYLAQGRIRLHNLEPSASQKEEAKALADFAAQENLDIESLTKDESPKPTHKSPQRSMGPITPQKSNSQMTLRKLVVSLKRKETKTLKSLGIQENEDIYQVWFPLDPKTTTDNIPLEHQQNAFLESRIHDWDLIDQKFTYYGGDPEEDSEVNRILLLKGR